MILVAGVVAAAVTVIAAAPAMAEAVLRCIQ